jgi:hypothetical protein
MTDHRSPTHTAARSAWSTRVAALTAACIVVLQPAPRAHAATAPEVPLAIEVPEGNRVLRIEHAIGTQNYICLPSTMTPPVAWVLIGPQATLFNKHGRQTMTHFSSPNADETGDPLRPTWQDSRDTSALWAKKVDESSDPEFVEPDAIPWLLLEIVGRDIGTGGGRDVNNATVLQRVNTSGGKAPATGCTDAAHVGAREDVPYTADYVFYRSIGPLA